MRESFQKFIAASIAATLVASAVAPVSAAQQTVASKASNAVKAYENFKITRSDDSKKAVSLEKNATKAVSKLTKKYAKLKTTLTKRIANQRKKVNAAIAKIKIEEAKKREAEAQRVATAAVSAVKASISLITATTPISNVQDQYDKVKALINKVSNETVKSQLQTQLDQFKKDALTKIDSLQPTIITYVYATNSKTIIITGSKLNKLRATDLKLSGYPVGSLTVTTDGNTATIKLSKDLLIAERNILTATINGQTFSFDVPYNYVTISAVVQSGTYDNTTSGQQLTILVNGQPTSADALVSAGYTVKFAAFTLKDDGSKDKDVTRDIIADPSRGTLLVKGSASDNKYGIEVTLANGSVSITSLPAPIIIKQLLNSPVYINSVSLYNEKLNDYQKSSTLYLGEKAYFNKYVLVSGSNLSDLIEYNAPENSKAAFSIQSSKPNVISVDDNNRLKAESIGTATIIITYGNSKKEVTLTVAGAPRKISRVLPSLNSMRAIADGSFDNRMKLTVLDQYGDVIKNLNSGDVNLFLPSLTGLTNVNTAIDISTGLTTVGGSSTNYASGAGTLSLNSLTTPGETKDILFKDRSQNVIGSFSVSTVARSIQPNVYELNIDSSSLSKDDIINPDLVNSDSSLTYSITKYTSDYISLGAADLTGYKVVFNSNTISVNGLSPTLNHGEYEVTLGTGVSTIDVTPLTNGSTTFKVINPSGTQIGTTRIITVNKQTPTITAVNWKNVLPISTSPRDPITYKNVLNYIEGKVLNKDTSKIIYADDLVNGVTISTPVPNSIRISKAVGHEGDIYIDKDENGTYTNLDTKIGHLDVTVSNDALGKWASYIPNPINRLNSITGIKPLSSDKGTLVFSLYNDLSDTNAISTYPITVYIK